MKSKRPILTFASKTSNSFTKSFSGWFSMFFFVEKCAAKELTVYQLNLYVFFLQKKCTQKKFAVYSRYFKHSFLRSTNKSFKAYGISMNVTRYRISLTQLFGGDFYNQHTFLKLKGLSDVVFFLTILSKLTRGRRRSKKTSTENLISLGKFKLVDSMSPMQPNFWTFSIKRTSCDCKKS